MKVIVTSAALADLEDIADYIALDNLPRALSFTDELEAVARTLGDFPQAYPLVTRYERYGVRRRPYGNYLIFYEIIQDTVFITHILNSAQDYEAILFPQS